MIEFIIRVGEGAGLTELSDAPQAEFSELLTSPSLFVSHLRCRNLEALDLFLDFVNEAGGAGPIHNAMIERQRQRDDFGGLVFLSVGNNLLMRAADKQCGDRRR